MTTKDKENLHTNWHEIWMQQNAAFLESAKKYMNENTFSNPEANLKQINAWLENLKMQWETTKFAAEQQAYWSKMTEMYQDASKIMLEQWIKRSNGNNPIKNIQELYELWLGTCHEVYQQALKTKSFQEAYGDLMQSSLKFWQSAIAK